MERDPTKFCTYEAFEAGVGALKTFCDLRVQSVRAQLSGDDTSIDTAGLDLSAMGSMNMGGGFDRDNRGQREETGTAPQMPAFRQDAQQQTAAPSFPQPDVAAPAGAGILQTVIWAVVLLAGLLVAFLYKR